MIRTVAGANIIFTTELRAREIRTNSFYASNKITVATMQLW